MYRLIKKTQTNKFDPLDVVDSLVADMQTTDRYLEHKIDVAEMRYYIELGLSMVNVVAIGILYTLKFIERMTNNADTPTQIWNIPPKTLEMRENLLNKWAVESNKRKS